MLFPSSLVLSLSLSLVPGSAGGVPPAAAPALAPAPAAAFDFVAAADYSASKSGRAVLVLHKGELAFERYDNGWAKDRPHALASGTKSFTGVMAMMAVQDGLIELDELASDTLAEWKSDPAKSKITVRHLLTLTSGLKPGDRELSGGNAGGGRVLGEVAAERAKRLGIQDRARPDNWFTAAIALPSEHPAGSRFEYGPSHFFAFGELLQRKLQETGAPQQTTLAYLSERVFKPVGINVARIGRDKAGNPNLPGGAMLTAAEWAKFGQFVLQQGAVRQPDGSLKQLLRPELLAQCFEGTKANPSYGLTWWLPGGDAGAEADVADGAIRARRPSAQLPAVRAVGPDGQPLRIFMAAGLGKQRLYVIPAYDLVVVRFAEATRAGQSFDDAAFLGSMLGQPKPR